MTSEELMTLLMNKYRWNAHRWVLIKELRLGCGFAGGAERRIDLFAIGSNASSGCTAIAYEIKVSKADFKRDMEDPLKQRGARLFSDQFYFVAPVGIIRPGDVPDWAGLLVPGKHGLSTAVPAPIRSKDAPSWPLVVSMLRREAIMVGGENGVVEDREGAGTAQQDGVHAGDARG